MMQLKNTIERTNMSETQKNENEMPKVINIKTMKDEFGYDIIGDYVEIVHGTKYILFDEHERFIKLKDKEIEENEFEIERLKDLHRQKNERYESHLKQIQEKDDEIERLKQSLKEKKDFITILRININNLTE